MDTSLGRIHVELYKEIKRVNHIFLPDPFVVSIKEIIIKHNLQ